MWNLNKGKDIIQDISTEENLTKEGRVQITDSEEEDTSDLLGEELFVAEIVDEFKDEEENNEIMVSTQDSGIMLGSQEEVDHKEEAKKDMRNPKNKKQAEEKMCTKKEDRRVSERLKDAGIRIEEKNRRIATKRNLEAFKAGIKIKDDNLESIDLVKEMEIANECLAQKIELEKDKGKEAAPYMQDDHGSNSDFLCNEEGSESDGFIIVQSRKKKERKDLALKYLLLEKTMIEEINENVLKKFDPDDFNIIRYSREKNKMGPVHKHTDAFNDLIQYHELHEIVDNIWSKPCKAKSALDKIQQKLKLCKQYLKGWDWNMKGQKKKRKAQIQVDLGNLEKLEEQYGLNTHQLELKMSLLGENLDMIIEEETYWKQRSHEKWLLKGDGNNEFFHRIASGRKKKNDILFFEDNGTRIEGDHMLEHATSYYADLFGPTPGNLF
ncbi:hypothetical protein ZEAMMB73_Zm00001d026294 [Zea mays]|uniref:Uncharacterized protein n=2 Tax=Zea mays TaxID=4577 RepID=A0A1D6JE73_MAIZE|nr:hypothetical protein ZEAMMB73_Zm00001d026294 [Zea mays]